MLERLRHKQYWRTTPLIEICLLRKHFSLMLTYAGALYHIYSINVLVLKISVRSVSHGPVRKIDPTNIMKQSICCVPYDHTRMVHTVRIWFVPYAYGMFFCTIRVWLYHTIIYVSHSIKLSVGTGGSIYQLTNGLLFKSEPKKAMFIIASAS